MNATAAVSLAGRRDARPPAPRLRILVPLALGLLWAVSSSEAQVIHKWSSQEPGLRAVDVAIDASGAVYVTGLSPLNAANGFRHDIVTVKYDADGNVVWLHEFDETDDATNGDDEPNWLALDPMGNLLVTGRSFINTSGDDLITLKYSPDGQLLWKARTTAGVEGHRVATDAAGNVIVAGRNTDASSRDFLTVKYDPNGNLLWTRTYNGPNNFTDHVNGLALTAAGDIVVTGESTGGVTSFDVATVYYEADGTERWVRRYTSQSTGADRGKDVAVGPGDEIYVGGHVSEAGTTAYVLIRYDVLGNEIWARTLDGPLSDLGKRVAADSQANAILTGISSSDIVTVKYDPDGELLWSTTFSSGGEDFASGIAVGDDDSIYVTGDSLQQVVIVKYDPDGAEAWSDVVDNGVFPDRGYNVAVDGEDNVAVAAQSPILTLYYSQEGGGIPCGDLVLFQARCTPAGTIQVRAVFADESHAGETVTFGIDGVPQVRTIFKNVASYQEPAAGFGAHTITLDDPAGCAPPSNVNCPQ